jgi:hypothetical protein
LSLPIINHHREILQSKVNICSYSHVICYAFYWMGFFRIRQVNRYPTADKGDMRVRRGIHATH